MELEKTGKFISELRKEKGMTQKQLGEILNVTDKAVSKWECGHNLPDNEIMSNLCEKLEISINELLSGEKISSEDYNKKAEENMMRLVEENKENTKKSIGQRLTELGGILILVLFLYLVIDKAIGSRLEIHDFLDLVGLHIDLVLPTLMLLLTGKFKAFLKLFQYNFMRCDDTLETQKAKEAGSFAIKAVLLSGGICSFLYLVQWLSDLDNAGYYGPNLANIVIGIFYSFILSAIILVLKERI